MIKDRNKLKIIKKEITQKKYYNLLITFVPLLTHARVHTKVSVCVFMCVCERDGESISTLVSYLMPNLFSLF